MTITFELLEAEELDKIKPLWEKLNEIHLHDSLYFKDHFKSNTFETRFRNIKETAAENLRIEVIKDNNHLVGYCVSSIKKEVGEIESLFLENDYQIRGLGKQLVQNALEWFSTKDCLRILVGVAVGHEKVFGFYQKMGFFPRTTLLEFKKQF